MIWRCSWPAWKRVCVRRTRRNAQYGLSLIHIYLNSPETPIFHKSRNLFALNLSKSTKNDYFILAEGYMEVIALHQAGFDSAVASLGTSLTEEPVSYTHLKA